MTQTYPLVLRLVASSVNIAKHAGKIIRDVRKDGNLGIVDKGVNDFQTIADRRAQRCILSSLSLLFPNVVVIGEEGDSGAEAEESIIKELDPEVLLYKCPQELESVCDDQITVWVDPLDGTSEYTKGALDNVTVLIGIAVDGKAVAGVIHQPYYGYDIVNETWETDNTEGRTIWGIVGLGTGAYTPRTAPEGKKIVVTTKSHDSELVRSALESIKPHEIIRVGGLGNKVVLLLEGIAHAYVYASGGSKKWDTCAPEAVLTAAGGKLTDICGNDYDYSKDVAHENLRGVLATASKDDHTAYKECIPSYVTNKFINLK